MAERHFFILRASSTSGTTIPEGWIVCWKNAAGLREVASKTLYRTEAEAKAEADRLTALLADGS